MARRFVIVGLGVVNLLLSACVGPSNRPAMPPVAGDSMAPSSPYSIMQSPKGYAPTYRHPWPLKDTPQPTPSPSTEVAKESTPSPYRTEPLYRFQRPPVTTVAQEKEAEQPLTPLNSVQEASPFERLRQQGVAFREVKANEPLKSVIASTPAPAPTLEVEKPPPALAPVEAPREKLPSDVTAPEWPVLSPSLEQPVSINKAPARLDLPIKGPEYPKIDASKVSTTPVDPPSPEINLKPIVDLQPAPQPVKPPTRVVEFIFSENTRTREKIVRPRVKEFPPELPPAPLKEIVEETPTAPESPLVLAIRAFQAKEPSRAVDYLKQYDPANQEMLLTLMPILVRLGENSVGSMSPDELAIYLEQLQGVSGLLRPRAALKADTVCFCRRVLKFGKYEALEADHQYQAAEPVELYFELRNFTWEPPTTGKKVYGMRLGSTLEIRDAERRIVWRRDLTTTDTRQTPPMDYYLVYRFALPELPPGAYTLDVQVVDQLDSVRRFVRRSLELRMGPRQ